MAIQDLNYRGSSNRVMDALSEYAEHNGKYAIDNSIILKKDPVAISLQRDFYRQLRKGYRKKKDLTKEEKASLKFARHEITVLNMRLRPWYSPFILIRLLQLFVDAIDPKYATVVLHRQNIENIQKDQSRIQNSQNLQEQLKKSGFKISLEGPLEKALRHDLPAFHLRYSDPGLKNTEYILHFKKIPKTDTYYFERYEAAPVQTLQDVLSKTPRSAYVSFAVLDQSNFSALEAASLVNGKPIHKTIEGQGKWYSFDYTRRLPGQAPALRTFDLNLETQISELPIKEFSNSVQKNKILSSLKTGQRQEVSLKLEGGDQKFIIEINANTNKLQMYDQTGRLVETDSLLKNGKSTINKKLMTQAFNPKKRPPLQRMTHQKRA